MNSIGGRQIVDKVMRALCALSTAFLGFMLLLILSHVIREGSRSLNWTFLTHASLGTGESNSGMGNAILGSIIIVLMASIIGLPTGIFCGVYLAEFGRGRFASSLQFLIEVLNGIPTIVFGILAYSLVVAPFHSYSAYAGGLALATIMVPLISRTTEVVVRLVPRSWREASIALGASTARTILSVVLPGAKAGIITGSMLAIARVAGETAPLLFTALGNDAWPSHPSRPTAALPLQVFIYAQQPYADLKSQAWAGALVLVGGILILNILVRVFARSGVDVAGKM